MFSSLAAFFSTSSSWVSMKVSICDSNDGDDDASILIASSPALVALPIATVATGIPELLMMMMMIIKIIMMTLTIPAGI